MQMRTKLAIVTVIGAGALLIMTLAVMFTLRFQTAYAQDSSGPSASISFGEDSIRQGAGTYLVVVLQHLPKDDIDPFKLPALTDRFDLERKSDGEWSPADSCKSGVLGRNINLDRRYDARKLVDHRNNGLSIPASCPIEYPTGCGLV